MQVRNTEGRVQWGFDEKSISVYLNIWECKSKNQRERERERQRERERVGGDVVVMSSSQAFGKPKLKVYKYAWDAKPKFCCTG